MNKSSRDMILNIVPLSFAALNGLMLAHEGMQCHQLSLQGRRMRIKLLKLFDLSTDKADVVGLNFVALGCKHRNHSGVGS